MADIPLNNQILAIKQKWKNATVSATCRGGKLIWNGKLQPTGISNTYRVRLEYSSRSWPEVYVVSPKLQRVNGEKPPHIYSFEEQHLCLYYHEDNDWNRDMKIAETIIPWTTEWLLFYELWLSTGIWHGGGVHDGIKT